MSPMIESFTGKEENAFKKCRKRLITWLVQRPVYTSFFIILIGAMLSPIFLMWVLTITALICNTLEAFATPGGIIIAYTLTTRALLFTAFFSVLYVIGLTVTTIFGIIQAIGLFRISRRNMNTNGFK